MADSALLDTVPDTPVITARHPAVRSAPASRPPHHRRGGRRRGNETLTVGILVICIAVMIAALGYLTVGPPLRRTVPLGRHAEPVTTTTVPSRGPGPPPARVEAPAGVSVPPTLGADPAGIQQGPSARGGQGTDAAGSDAPVRQEGRPPAEAPEPAAEPPTATQPPTTETPPPPAETTTTGPPETVRETPPDTTPTTAPPEPEPPA